MVNQRVTKLRLQKLIRKKFIRMENKLYLLKSIKKNKNQQPANLSYYASLPYGGTRGITRTRLHNYCQLTGRARGYFKLFGLSRHAIKKKAAAGLLQNIKACSW